MNTVLQNLWQQLLQAGAPVRWALAACAGFALAITGFLVYRAQNPHFVVLAADLDAQSFNTAITALAGADIRYETSMGPAPYMIRVESGKKYDAMTAIHLSGEFLGGSRGITSGLAGSSSVFLGQSERHQRTQKRIWEETEMQLERLNFVAKAKVSVSGGATSPLARLRPDERRASVVLTLRGLSRPTATETRALVGIVRGSTGVADDRITIVDQHSNVLFDGASGSGPDSVLAMEERFGRERTDAVQAILDRTFGAGVTVVGVTGQWKQVREESISEKLDPVKTPRSQRSRKTSSPEWARSVGGPAGVAANTQSGTGGSAGGPTMELSTTNEEEKAYSFGRSTIHSVSQPHQLERLSISLVVDQSKSEELTKAEDLVKGFLGFNEERGDTLKSFAAEIPGLERNGEGVPVLPEPVKAPEPTSPMISILLEYGLELVAGIAFLVVLLKSLKGSRASAPRTAPDGTIIPAGSGGAAAASGGSRRRSGQGGSSGEADGDPFEEEVDMDALARAHIEELLRAEPEKVSALLSRWALSEDVYAESGSR